MKKTLATLCAAAISLTSLGMASAPASAAPLQTSIQITGGAELISVRDRRDRKDRKDRFERRGNAYYFNGFKGDRRHRPGWRSYGGWYFPPSAFSFGITINPPSRPGIRLSARHINWCEDHYRSYRRSDNTFKPVGAPRRQCISPFV
jgi:hypothetical protein